MKNILRKNFTKTKNLKLYKKISEIKILEELEKIYKQRFLFKTAKQWEKIIRLINPYNLFNFSFNYKTIKHNFNKINEDIEIVIFKKRNLKKLVHINLQKKYIKLLDNN